MPSKKRVRSSAAPQRTSKRVRSTPQRFRPGSDLLTEVRWCRVFNFYNIIKPRHFYGKYNFLKNEYYPHIVYYFLPRISTTRLRKYMPIPISRTSKVPPSAHKDGCGAWTHPTLEFAKIKSQVPLSYQMQKPIQGWRSLGRSRVVHFQCHSFIFFI